MTTVLIKGKFFDNHSLAIINRYLAIGLSKKFDVYIEPLDIFNPSNKVNPNILRQLKELIAKPIPAPEIINVEIRHSYPPDFSYPDKSNKAKILYIQPWEFSKIPFEWQYKFEQFADHLIVPSNWTAQIFLKSGINPEDISVIPNGYDPEIFTKAAGKTTKFDTNMCTFTYVGCAQYRKGVDILLNAWKDAFVKADNAQLFIKDTPAIYGSTNLLEEIIKLQYKTECAKVIYNDELLSDTEMASIYASSKVLVHPYRGEGFGMHVQEAMACGAFPLVTGGGALDDFVSIDNGMLINSSQKLVNFQDPNIFAGKPGDSFTLMGTHCWMTEPDGADLVNKMKFIYYHHERDKLLSRVTTAKTLHTWNQVVDRFSTCIETVLHDKTPKRFRH